MEKYYVICNSDGDTRIDEVSRDELLKRLDLDDPYYGRTDFLSEISDSDTNYWGEKILIIKGSIVTPKPIEYDIE